MSKALVVGGNGFIGAHLVQKLVQIGWDVTVLHKYEQPRYSTMPDAVRFLRGDLTQESLLAEAVAGQDVVFHLLWTTTAIHEVANRDPAADVQANLVPTIHLMEACRAAGVGRLVFTSSGGTVYGRTQIAPIPEDHPNNPVTAYGVSKLAVEKYLQMFHHLHGLDFVVLRPSVPYGPYQNPLARQGAVAVFLYRVAKGLPLTIWGDGSVTRDYFYISDLVDALILGSTQPINSQRIFNLGGAEEVSLNHLIALAEETVGRKAVVTYQPARDFDAPRVLLDTTQAETMLGWQPKVPMKDGLAKTWEWMQDTIL
ncbi:MAG: NAD-dependent epimerase/dehydratase family protein [Ardenticatenaceae bacterium]|nr:NAD-dependent epimerase/dehydratase family protein [Anaerolineales bacterium]MCB8940807.1 NAD-dependent epimerase/dehydratase family protein [Ardenticatenaceae bacterium]MCB8972146.1 NAD-dependent epimerase/dehydratase family protein [Ardenticatenaceae bacterium]